MSNHVLSTFIPDTETSWHVTCSDYDGTAYLRLGLGEHIDDESYRFHFSGRTRADVVSSLRKALEILETGEEDATVRIHRAKVTA